MAEFTVEEKSGIGAPSCTGIGFLSVLMLEACIVSRRYALAVEWTSQ
jgi:hypothetical protein